MAPRIWNSAYTLGEEIANFVTHGLGLLLSIIGLATLVVIASRRGDAWHVAGCAIFGAALVFLYAASTLYHGVNSGRAKQLFRKLDHAAIFVLIAGTYTPFMIVNLRGSWGWTLLGVVWALAALGIVLQTAVPWGRRLSIPLYLAMGWLVVIAAEPLASSLNPDGLALLVSGGGAYTLGVAFYVWRELPYNHAIWHLFVLAGSALHFSCVLGFVIPPAA